MRVGQQQGQLCLVLVFHLGGEPRARHEVVARLERIAGEAAHARRSVHDRLAVQRLRTATCATPLSRSSRDPNLLDEAYPSAGQPGARSSFARYLDAP